MLIPSFCEDQDPALVIDAVTAATNLPVVLYNPPENRFKGVTILTSEIMDRIKFPNRIAGIKDSTGKNEFFDNWLEFKLQHPDFVVATGSTKNLHESRKCFVISAANTHPAFFAEFVFAHKLADLNGQEKQQYFEISQPNHPDIDAWWAARRLHDILTLKKTQGLVNPDAIKQWWALRSMISCTYPFDPNPRPLP